MGVNGVNGSASLPFSKASPENLEYLFPCAFYVSSLFIERVYKINGRSSRPRSDILAKTST